MGAALPGVLEETTGGQTTYYVYGLDLLSTIEGTTATYYLTDGLGSTTGLLSRLATSGPQQLQGTDVDCLFREAIEMEENDLMAIGRKLEELIRTSDEPREALADLVRQHGPERAAVEARIVFGSWRTRIDLVEETLMDVLAKHNRTDL